MLSPDMPAEEGSVLVRDKAKKNSCAVCPEVRPLKSDNKQRGTPSNEIFCRRRSQADSITVVDGKVDVLSRKPNCNQYHRRDGAATGVGGGSGTRVGDLSTVVEEVSAAGVGEDAPSSTVVGATDVLDAVLLSTDEELSVIESRMGALEVGDGDGPAHKETARFEAPEHVGKRMALEVALIKKENTFQRKGPLSAEEDIEVDGALNSGSDSDVLVKAFKVDLTRRSMKRLLPNGWLNDEVVNMYMELLACRDRKLCGVTSDRRPSHFLSSFFLEQLDGSSGKYSYESVRRWTRKVNVFEMDKIIVPVNVSNRHWCMAVIYMQKKRINYYDSMGGEGRSVMRTLLRWLEDEAKAKNRPDDDVSEAKPPWTTVGTDTNTTPQQENGSDCGVFAVSYASYASDDLAFDFQQADVPQMRRRMVWSLLKQELI